MSRAVQILLAIFSGLLLGFSWPEISDQTWLVFFAFVPIYYLLDNTKKENWRSLFLLSFLSFIIWHLISVYWMVYSTVIGSASAWLVNATLMATVVSLSLFIKTKAKKIPIEVILSLFWLSFEIMHLFWSLSWPWMDLGNVFANKTEWIQWYEYSGIYGGGFWVLLVNGIIYRTLKLIFQTNYLRAGFTFSGTLLLIFTPIIFSNYLFTRETPSTESIEISVLQPNIDTYTEKFNGLTPLEQSNKIIEQLNSKHTAKLIILPETAIPENFDIRDSIYPKSINQLLKWTEEHNKQIIGGFYSKDSLNYNSALLIEEGKIISVRHKQKLLPFGESMPFDWFYKVFEKQIARDGGNTSGFGRDSEVRVFDLRPSTKFGALICFESAFPDITSKMLRNGAQILLVITNDDWWKDTPGYKQHFAYSRIRAIETRRFIARSANTGISGFINEKGQVLQSSNYKSEALLSSKCYLHSQITLFSQNENKYRFVILSFSFLLLLTLVKLKT